MTTARGRRPVQKHRSSRPDHPYTTATLLSSTRAAQPAAAQRSARPASTPAAEARILLIRDGCGREAVAATLRLKWNWLPPQRHSPLDRRPMRSVGATAQRQPHPDCSLLWRSVQCKQHLGPFFLHCGHSERSSYNAMHSFIGRTTNTKAASAPVAPQGKVHGMLENVTTVHHEKNVVEHAGR